MGCKGNLPGCLFSPSRSATDRRLVRQANKKLTVLTKARGGTNIKWKIDGGGKEGTSGRHCRQKANTVTDEEIPTR